MGPRRRASLVGAAVVAAGLVAVGTIRALEADGEEPFHASLSGVGGVGLGSSRDAVVRRFGEPVTGDGIFPPGEDYTGPVSLVSIQGSLRYDGVSFLLGPSDIVDGFVLTRERSDLAGAVRVGNELDDVREKYPGATCGESVAGEALIGDNPTYPWCAPRLRGETRVHFGGDPINSITVTRAP